MAEGKRGARFGGLANLGKLFKSDKDSGWVNVEGMPTPTEFASSVQVVIDKATRKKILLNVDTPWGHIRVDARPRTPDSGLDESVPEWMEA